MYGRLRNAFLLTAYALASVCACGSGKRAESLSSPVPVTETTQASTTASYATRNAHAKHVIVVSIDGGKPAVLLDAGMSALSSFVSQGATSWQARTILPSLTLPSHTSMLTGVSPSVHQMLWNSYDPNKGIVTVPTVFSVAKQHGKRTALIAGKQKFKHLLLPGSVDYEFTEPSDALPLAKRAVDQLRSSPPDLMFVHFPDADLAGHRDGWGSEPQRKSLRDIDVALSELRAGVHAFLASDTVMLITADHGGTGYSHGSASDADVLIPWIAWGAHTKKGHKLETPIRTMDTAATALWLLGVGIPSNWEGTPVVEAFDDLK